MTKLTTTLKTILVFKNGDLAKQITYKTKIDAKRHYLGFLRHGILDPNTANQIEGTTFELL